MSCDEQAHLAPVGVAERLRFEHALAALIEAGRTSRPEVPVVGGGDIVSEAEFIAAQDAEEIRRVVSNGNDPDQVEARGSEALALLLTDDQIDNRPPRTEEYRTLLVRYLKAIERAAPWQFDELQAADVRNLVDDVADEVARMAALTVPSDDLVVDDDWDDDDDDLDGDDDDDRNEEDDDLDGDEEGDYDVDLDDLRSVMGVTSTAPTVPTALAAPIEPRVW